VPGRGPLTHKKRQRELLLKEKQAAKLARRLERKREQPDSDGEAAEGETVEESQADVPESSDPESE
jgi:hypothetical protein